jgi:dTDP-glucose 4,6-dehydratase
LIGRGSLIENVEDRPGHDKRYSINAKKIKTQLNWKPTFDFDVALSNTVKWYISNEKWLCNSADHHKTDEYEFQNSNYGC